jgi:hypothetical protein
MNISSSPGVRSTQTVPGDRTPSTDAPVTSYFALAYTAAAPPGLPPAVQASWVTVDESMDGPWISFHFLPPLASQRAEPLCILRVHESHVAKYVEHGSLREALHAVT